MPRDGTLAGRSARALDLLNFFLADVQTGFGPFVAVYLTAHKWTQGQIGLALSLGTIVALAGQVPAGMMVDAAQNKRRIAGIGLVGVMAAALLLALWPAELPVLVAETLHALASCVISPAIAAISLHLVGHQALGERLGRNARFGSIGNGLAAGVMGVGGLYLSSRAVFWFTAVLCVPALLALIAIGRGGHARRQTTVHPFDRAGLVQLFRDRRLLIFGGCVLLFHLSNAAMLPLAGAAVTMRAGSFANLIIGACIVVPQGVVALASPWVGRRAADYGRRSMLLLGWLALPVRGVLLAVLPGPYLLVAGQAISGISAAVFGVMLPLIAADLTRGSSHFNLCLGVLGLAVAGGAALSTGYAGWVADAVGMRAAFFSLAFAGLAGTLLVLAAMPETKPP
ncbi:MAG TPA: MFS transporter [Acetobacteraceae bacterium]|jgi:MFS family permease|nr:MFS transporter [Acetobacteraceae bacterium]